MIHSHEAVLEVSVCFLSGSCSAENSWVFVALCWADYVFFVVLNVCRCEHEIQMKVFACKRPCGECSRSLFGNVVLCRFSSGGLVLEMG